MTTDGIHSLAKAMREHNATVRQKVQHSKCFIHNMRNLHKSLRAANIKVPKRTDRLLYRTKVSNQYSHKNKTGTYQTMKACAG